MNETLRQIEARKSVRAFEDREIPEADKTAILHAATMGPTAGNQQLYTILDITDPALRARLVPRSVASIGMTAIISVVNLIIPSATSKAAILVPILQPIAQTLNMDPNLAVQAFQYGDGFTNLFSPFLGWTVGSCVMAGVPFPKWFKWILPKVLCFIALGFVIMFILTESGWTAF